MNGHCSGGAPSAPGEARAAGRPPLTVVVAVPARATCPRATLEALGAQAGGEGLIERVVVARAGTAGSEAPPPRLRGRVIAVEAPPNAAEPALWLAGAELATTAYVAFLDSLALPDAGWAREIVAALDGGADAVGGAVEPDDAEGGRAWATFLCDYGAFLPPLAARSAGDGAGPPSLPGNNVAFRAAALREVLAARPRAGLRKSLLLRELAARGSVIRRVPGATIRLRGSGASLRDALVERFARGRAYAGLASAGRSQTHRFVRVLGVPLVPFVMLRRLERDLRGKPAARRAWLRSLPTCLALQAAWALGEGLGTLRGPGDPSRVR